MKKKLHILFLCGWYPSSVLPQNGDFIMRHAQSVHLKHNVSILHIITKSDISKTEIEVIKEGNLFTYIVYVPQSSNPIIKLIRFFGFNSELAELLIILPLSLFFFSFKTILTFCKIGGNPFFQALSFTNVYKYATRIIILIDTGVCG